MLSSGQTPSCLPLSFFCKKVLPGPWLFHPGISSGLGQDELGLAFTASAPPPHPTPQYWLRMVAVRDKGNLPSSWGIQPCAIREEGARVNYGGMTLHATRLYSKVAHRCKARGTEACSPSSCVQGWGEWEGFHGGARGVNHCGAAKGQDSCV